MPKFELPAMWNPSTEDYIKHIYALQHGRASVSTSALAATLGIRDASVTSMVKKLASRGIVKYRRYHGVELTGDGRRQALKILRKHRLWEVYLSRVFGFSWDKIHDEADRLEHVTSDALERRLDAALGFPRIDPHGDPIPDAAGTMQSSSDFPLMGCAPGQRVRVKRVRDGDAAVLKRASLLGINLGRTMDVIGRRSRNGPLKVRIGTRQRVVRSDIAAAIFVEPG